MDKRPEFSITNQDLYLNLDEAQIKETGEISIDIWKKKKAESFETRLWNDAHFRILFIYTAPGGDSCD